MIPSIDDALRVAIKDSFNSFLLDTPYPDNQSGI